MALPAKIQPALDFKVTEEFEGGPDFVGGWVGFLSYEQGLKWMGVTSRHKSELPMERWIFCDEVFAFFVTEESEPASADFSLSGFGPSLSFEEYSARFEELQGYLRVGDSYQVNLSMDFSGKFAGDPFDFYCANFARNPSTMSVYFELDDFVLASNSPERLFSLREGILRAEPIKGTLQKPANPQELLDDPKAYSELTMIVDLLRNDLGRVAETGSVRVLEHRALMELANLWHTYSVIEARLRSDLTVLDALRAIFPGGSVTGCPKLRTMQIIDRLENYSRGAYCGSVGYVSLNGRADFNILIRTATIRDGLLHFPAGGGVLVDSTARAEYEEAVGKVRLT